ncbi:MAG: septum formation protein Maf [Rhodobacteraceae bacterium]|nr:septum formation protein Maf [Paracoccaceae bacterium]
MTKDLILASGSEIRAQLLRNAGLEIGICPAQIDEDETRERMLAAGVAPADIAEALAEEKASKIAALYPRELVLGCDQVAAYGGTVLGKPESPAHASAQLASLSGQTHHLLSAAVLFDAGDPVWRHVGKVTLQMHDLSDDYINDYVDRNWLSIRHSVGCYKLEEEGVRLFSAVQGDYFHVLGLPLIELLSYLRREGELKR